MPTRWCVTTFGLRPRVIPADRPVGRWLCGPVGTPTTGWLIHNLRADLRTGPVGCHVCLIYCTFTLRLVDLPRTLLLIGHGYVVPFPTPVGWLPQHGCSHRPRLHGYAVPRYRVLRFPYVPITDPDVPIYGVGWTVAFPRCLFTVIWCPCRFIYIYVVVRFTDLRYGC